MSESESNSIDNNSNDMAVSNNAPHSDTPVSENTPSTSPTNNIFVGKKPVSRNDSRIEFKVISFGLISKNGSSLGVFCL